MSKWINFTIDERKAMIQAVSEAKQIDEASVEKDWWVTAVLYAMFHISVSEYLLFKGGTSLSKGWDIINRFSEDIDLALNRDFFLNVNKDLHNRLLEKKSIMILLPVREDIQGSIGITPLIIRFCSLISFSRNKTGNT